jgi:hypothetical protein
MQHHSRRHNWTFTLRAVTASVGYVGNMHVIRDLGAATTVFQWNFWYTFFWANHVASTCSIFTLHQTTFCATWRVCQKHPMLFEIWKPGVPATWRFHTDHHHIQWCLEFVCLFEQLRTAALMLIVRSWSDVRTFATGHLHACHHTRAPSSGRWNCGREMSGNFAEMTTYTPFRDLLRAVKLLHGTDGFTCPLKEGVLRIFFTLKIWRLRPGVNPRIMFGA